MKLKLLGVIAFGVLASFALTLLSELLVSSMPIRGWHLYVWLLGPEFPLIALLVGSVVGMITKNRAKSAAALSLAPWAVWLIVGTNESHPTVSSCVTTVALFSVYMALGVGAAAFVGSRMVRSAARSPQSPSQAGH